MTTPLEGDRPLWGADAAPPAADPGADALVEIGEAQGIVDDVAARLSDVVTNRDALIRRHFQAGMVRQTDVARVTGLTRGRIWQIVAQVGGD